MPVTLCPEASSLALLLYAIETGLVPAFVDCLSISTGSSLIQLQEIGFYPSFGLIHSFFRDIARGRWEGM